MSVESVMGVVVRGEGMVRGRSGMEVVNRIMRVRGGDGGGEGEEIMMSSGFGGRPWPLEGGYGSRALHRSSGENNSLNLNRVAKSRNLTKLTIYNILYSKDPHAMFNAV